MATYPVAGDGTNPTLEVDPISRIEGHLGVTLTTDATGKVTEANVHANLWRGFENFLIGREPNDAITFTQRICGVCPVPHATASMFAVESVSGANDCFHTFEYNAATGKGVPAKAVLTRNLIYASEFVMSHITHFYHLAAPSYVQGPAMPPWTPYFADEYYSPALRSSLWADTNALPKKTGDYSANLWSAVITQYVKALRMRRLTFEAGALFAGRMPMTSSFVAGGVTNDSTESNWAAKQALFKKLMAEVGEFVVKEYVPLALALGFLFIDFDNENNRGINPDTLDLLLTLPIGDRLQYVVDNVPTLLGGKGFGAGCKNFLAWGAFPALGAYVDGTTNVNTMLSLDRGFRYDWNAGAGTWDATGVMTKANVEDNLAEFTAKSWYDDSFNGDYPGDVPYTKPDRTDGTAYSWMKSPRWNGRAMEVGPYARMVVNGFYPVNGDTLVSKFPGYASYAQLDASGDILGLNPKMISLDLAVSLVRTSEAVGLPIANIETALGTVGYGGEMGIEAALARADIVDILNADTTYYTGLLADYILGLKGGFSTMDRLRGRALECLFLVQEMIGAYTGPADIGATYTFESRFNSAGWIDNAKLWDGGATYRHYPVPAYEVKGFGVSEAPRGALGHFITIDAGKIKAYQCVVPTTWNASPKDGQATEVRGPIEQAMMDVVMVEYGADAGSAAGGSYDNEAGATVATKGGVEALRVAQSFDPCIACAVH